MIVYDRSFNLNEWFIYGFMVMSVACCLLLPRRFPVSVVVLLAYFSFSVGLTADHTISVGAVDLYDVNESGAYELLDFITYLLYAPMAYLFVYFYDRWNVRGLWSVGYLAVWSLFAVGFEELTVLAGIFHYKGYRLLYSFPIYFAVQGITLLLYRLLLRSDPSYEPR